MKIVFQTLVIFFGTLMAAGLVALGEPGHAEIEMVRVGATQAASR